MLFVQQRDNQVQTDSPLLFHALFMFGQGVFESGIGLWWNLQGVQEYVPICLFQGESFVLVEYLVGRIQSLPENEFRQALLIVGCCPFQLLLGPSVKADMHTLLLDIFRSCHVSISDYSAECTPNVRTDQVNGQSSMQINTLQGLRNGITPVKIWNQFEAFQLPAGILLQSERNWPEMTAESGIYHNPGVLQNLRIGLNFSIKMIGVRPDRQCINRHIIRANQRRNQYFLRRTARPQGRRLCFGGRRSQIIMKPLRTVLAGLLAGLFLAVPAQAAIVIAPAVTGTVDVVGMVSKNLILR